MKTTAKKDKSYSAFKTLIIDLLSNEGDFSKLGEGIKKSCIKCFVKETYPKFLISDGSFFIAAYFTKEAFDKY
jgi:hypothetical protein